jgi:YVTN family beta-propeller protein
MGRFVVLAWVLLVVGGSAAAQTRSSAIAVTPDGSRVFVVNPDSNTVSVLETAGDTVVAEIPVGEAPATLAVAPSGATVWVANSDSNDLSVIDTATLAETARVPIGAQPFGVAVRPDGLRLYVANTNQARVTVVDTATLVVVAQIPTLARPKGVAVSADGSQVVVTHYLTPAPQLNGNVTIIATATNTVQAVAPLNLLPGRPGVAEIMPEVAVRPGTSQAWIPMVQGETGNPNLTLTTTVHPAFAVVNLVSGTETTALRTNLEDVLSRPVSQPSGIDFRADGQVAFIVSMASDDLAILNAATRTQLALVDVGAAPQGVAVTPSGAKSYVSNYLGRSVTVVATANPAAASVITTVPVTAEPLAPALINGKRLFFTARGRMSTDNRIACISCHPGGGHDARDWLFGSLGEGVRSTTDIRGIRDSGAVHWTANMDELQDLELNILNLQFGAGLIDGVPNDPFGPPNAGRSQDLDDFAAFMDSMLKPVRGNPNRAEGGGLTASAQRGKAIFESPVAACSSCHTGSTFSDSDRTSLVRHDVGTLAPGDVAGEEGFDTPSLLHLFDSPRYLHDGSAPTLLSVITVRNPNDEHGVTSHLTAPERQDLVNYLLQLDNDRDELLAGTATGLGTVLVPLRARDVSGTRLNGTDVRATNRIWGFDLEIPFDPDSVTDVTVQPAGVAGGLPIRLLDDPPADTSLGRKTYSIRFDEPLPLTVNAPAPGEVVALLGFTLDDSAAAAQPVLLGASGNGLSNDDGVKLERSALGNLLAVGGFVLVDTPAVADGTLGTTPLRAGKSGALVQLSWSAIDSGSRPVTYNVYQGSLATLVPTGSYEHACLESGLAAPSFSFAAGAGDLYYLVSAVVPGFGEGSLGTASSGEEIPNPNPCP